MPSHHLTPSLLLPTGAWLCVLLGGCDGSTARVADATRPATAEQIPATALAARVGSDEVPRIVKLDPPNGATDIDARHTALAVTFDRPMDREGWSWVIEGPESAPDLGEAAYDAAGRTNTVPARLLPGRTYVVWVNSPRYSYFRSVAGVPSEPLRWTFSTRAVATAPSAAARPGAMATRAAPPRVVLLEPPNGATEIDPALAVLRATFDRPMEASWSWVTERSNFPETTGDAYFEPDARTAAMPVRLEPGRTYVVWLNSEQYQLFRDQQGIAAPPLRWVFSTRPAG
jgi:RNA polymerase sigma-70 factor (ECF subfamily)